MVEAAANDNAVSARVRQFYWERAGGLVDFEDLVEATGAKTDADLAALVSVDAQEAITHNRAVAVERYALIDFARCPSARQAVVSAHSQSLYDLGHDELTLEAADRLALEAMAELEQQSPSVRRRRRAGRMRRAGYQFGIWTPIQLVLVFVFGVGMTVATLYWMGYIDTARLAQADAEHELEMLRQQYETIAAQHAKVNKRISAMVRYADDVEQLSLQEYERVVKAVEHEEELQVACFTLMRTLAAEAEVLDDEQRRQRFAALFDEALARVGGADAPGEGTED